jgi:uncharacterized membrane protein (DUF2068 family)
MLHLSRSSALKIAALVSFLNGVWGLFFTIPILARGADALNRAGDTPPYEVMIIAFVFAVLRLVAAPGVWQKQRWGIIITLIAAALDTIAAVPGILFGPTIGLKLAASTGVLAGLVVIVLCLWRDPQRATA